MSQPELISDPDQITSDWLTEVLNANNIEGSVNSFTAESIGTGQVGENVRFTLKGTGDLPATVVGKFPSPDPVSRATGVSLQNYEKEVYFYKHYQQRVNIQTPKVLFTDIDEQTHEFIILMEDLAPGVQGDQLAGCDAAAGELAMVQLAHLHGPLWCDDSIIDGHIIKETSDEPDVTGDLYNSLMPGFLERYQGRLNDQEIEMVKLVGECMSGYRNNFDGARTMIHIDYRLDNMMFGGPYPLAVVDWQSYTYGCGLNDASYFMGTSMRPDERAAQDESLLHKYYETLQTYDVNLSWEDCWYYYRFFAPAGLIMAVIASMIVGETERGNDMFMVMAKGSARMSRELDAIGAIRGS